jgi:hypothetical protein
MHRYKNICTKQNENQWEVEVRREDANQEKERGVEVEEER